jgi:hypothetical protein
VSGARPPIAGVGAVLPAIVPAESAAEAFAKHDVARAQLRRAIGDLDARDER